MRPLLPLLYGMLLLLVSCNPPSFRTADKNIRDGKFYLAMEQYLAFVKDHPDHPQANQALFNVGNLQQMVLNEPKKAIHSYQKLISSFPVSSYTLQAQKRLAEIYKNDLSDYQQAIIEYEKFTHIAPDHEDAPQVLFELAQCYTILRKFDQAELEYKSLKEKYPNYPKMDEVYFQMGNNAYIGSKYSAAIEAYQTLINKHENSNFFAQAIFGIGSSYEEMDDFDKAKLYYEKALKDYPTKKVVQIRLKGLEKRKARKANSTS